MNASVLEAKKLLLMNEAGKWDPVRSDRDVANGRATPLPGGRCY